MCAIALAADYGRGAQPSLAARRIRTDGSPSVRSAVARRRRPCGDRGAMATERRADHDRPRRRPRRRALRPAHAARARRRLRGRRRGRRRRRRLRTRARPQADVLVLDLNMPGRARARSTRSRACRRSRPTRASSSSRCRRTRRSPRGRCAPARPATCSRRPPTTSSSRRCGAPPPASTYLNPRLGARLAAAPPEPSGPPDDLTEREVEVLRLIALGHTNAEIAAAALPLGAHGRVAPRAHPAEARPLDARRARALRARPRARQAPASAAQAQPAAAARDRPFRRRPRAPTVELAAGRARRARACRPARSRRRDGLAGRSRRRRRPRTTSTASPSQRTAMSTRAARGVLDDVGQRLLDDAVDRRLELGGEAAGRRGARRRRATSRPLTAPRALGQRARAPAPRPSSSSAPGAAR